MTGDRRVPRPFRDVDAVDGHAGQLALENVCARTPAVLLVPA